MAGRGPGTEEARPVNAVLLADGDEMLRHLAHDLFVKGLIVLGAVVAAVVGIVVIWKRAGR
ncbi:hypothetical protein G3I59_03190 [Amycolatopsis rubida]|uniref:Uncharacterized protein n=1 Tax=Amycolatopsis rubida TaxID=112413 RepID=A0ABX0BP62_9PSEU|nr:hypothetical protein [Amycolatopsis rubida]NEC54628.1 hypothetical protein [Amycolatopsis rubida]